LRCLVAGAKTLIVPIRHNKTESGWRENVGSVEIEMTQDDLRETEKRRVTNRSAGARFPSL